MPEPTAVGRFEWERAVRDSDLPWLRKAFCLLLATYMDNDSGITYVGIQTLSTASGLARSGVHRHLSWLEARGWLHAIRSPGRKTHRVATAPANQSHRQEGSAEQTTVAGPPNQSHQQDGSGGEPVLPVGPDPSHQQDPPVLPVGPDPSHQQDPPVLPVGPDPSHQQDPITQSSLPDHNNTGAREEEAVIITAEDRTLHAEETITDRLRSCGVMWSDADVRDALRRLARIFGGDAAADGAAMGALVNLAKRPRRVDSLGAWLRTLSDDQVTALRPPTKRPADPGPKCIDPQCSNGWIGEDDDGKPFPCPVCKPAAVAQVRARRRSA